MAISDDTSSSRTSDKETDRIEEQPKANQEELAITASVHKGTPPDRPSIIRQAIALTGNSTTMTK